MKKYIAILLIILLAAVIYSQNLFQPFIYHHGSSLAEHGWPAKNYVKYGLIKSGLAPIETSGPIEYYDSYKMYIRSDHPFLPRLIAGITLSILGNHDWVMRIPLILFALATIPIFFAIASRLLSIKGAIISTLIFAFNPMYAYMSVVTMHQVNTLFFILLAFYFYLRWRDSRAMGNFITVIVAIFFACNMDWPGYYIAVVLFLYHFFIEQEDRKYAIAFLATNISIFCLYLLHLYLLDTENLYPLKTLLLAGTSRSFAGLPTLPQYLYSQAREIGLYFTVPICILSVIWLIRTLFFNRTKENIFIVFTLFLGLDLLIFVNLCYNHDFYAYYLVVFLSLSAGSELCNLWRKGTLCKILSSLLIISFAIQTYLVLHDRYTKVGAYELYYKMGIAINEKTQYKDRVIIATDNILYYTPYYADRYFLTYNRNTGELMESNLDGRGIRLTIAEFCDTVSKNKEGMDYLVLTTKDLVTTAVPYFEKIKASTSSEELNNIMQKFQIVIDPEKDELYKFLAGRYHSETYNGFIFFRLGK